MAVEFIFDVKTGDAERELGDLRRTMASVKVGADDTGKALDRIFTSATKPFVAMREFVVGIREGVQLGLQDLRQLSEVTEDSARKISGATSTVEFDVQGAGVFAQQFKAAADEAAKIERQIKLLKEFGGNTAGSTEAIATLEARLKQLKTTTNETQKEQEGMFASILKGGVVVEAASRAITFLTGQIGALLAATTEQQQNNLRLEATFKTLGSSATTSAANLRSVASQLKDTTTLDDDEVLKVAAKIAAQANLTQGTIEQVLRSSADLAALTGQSFEAVSTQLSKVLESPVEGSRQLKSLGIQLSATQKEQIKTAVELGDTYEAQRIILEEVRRRTDGLAESMSVGLAKATADTKRAVDDLFKALGASIFDAQTKDVNVFAASLNFLSGRITQVTEDSRRFFEIRDKLRADNPELTNQTIKDRALAQQEFERGARNRNLRATSDPRRVDDSLRQQEEAAQKLRINAERAEANLERISDRLRTKSDSLKDELEAIQRNFRVLAEVAGGKLTDEQAQQQARLLAAAQNKFAARGSGRAQKDDGASTLATAQTSLLRAQIKEQLTVELSVLAEAQQTYEQYFGNRLLSEQEFYTASIELARRAGEVKRQAIEDEIAAEELRRQRARDSASAAGARGDTREENKKLAEVAKVEEQIIALKRQRIELDRTVSKEIDALSAKQTAAARAQFLASAEQLNKLGDLSDTTRKLTEDQALQLAFAEKGLVVSASVIAQRQAELAVTQALKAENKARLELDTLLSAPANQRTAAFALELQRAERAYELARANTEELRKQGELITQFSFSKQVIEAQVAFDKLVDATRFEVSLLGLTAEQVERLKVSRQGQLEVQRAQLELELALAQATKEQQENEDGVTAATAARIKALEKVLSLTKQSASVAEDAVAQKQVYTEQVTLLNKIGDIGGKAFDSIREKGISGFKDIGTSIKNEVFAALKEIAVKKIIIPIAAQFLGIEGAALQGATQLSPGNILASILGVSSPSPTFVGPPVPQTNDAVSVVRNLYSVISGGFTNVGTKIAGFAENVLGLSQSTAQFLGSAGSLLAGIGTGFGVGNAISGGYGLGSKGQGSQLATGAGAIIGALIGGPIGSAIGGAIGGLVNRLFGRKLKDEGIQANLTAVGSKTQAFQFYKGGFFRSDKTFTSAADPETAAAIEAVRSAIFGKLQSFSTALDIGQSALAGFAFDLKISTKGLTPEQIQAALDKEFSRLAKEAALKLNFDEVSTDIRGIVSNFVGSSDDLFKFLDTVVAVKESFEGLESVVPNIKNNIGTLANAPEEYTQSILQIVSGFGPKVSEALRDQFQKIDLKNGISSIVKPDKSAFEQWAVLSAKVREVATAQILDTQRLAQLSQQRYQAEAALIQALISLSSAASQKYQANEDLFRTAFLTNEELYNYLNEKVTRLIAEAEAETDPVERAEKFLQAQEILAQAYGLLDEAQQRILSNEFLTRNADLNTRVQAATEKGVGVIVDDKDPNKEGSTAEAVLNAVNKSLEQLAAAGKLTAEVIEKAGSTSAEALQKGASAAGDTIAAAGNVFANAVGRAIPSDLKILVEVDDKGNATAKIAETGQFAKGLGV